MLDETAERDILHRLTRIEGQIRGLRRLIEDEYSYEELTTQLSATLSALEKVNTLIVGYAMYNSLKEADIKEEKHIYNKIKSVIRNLKL